MIKSKGLKEMKQALKKVLSIGRFSSLSELRRELKSEKFSVVSFDVFDTLLARAVPCPEDVFRLTERQYLSQYNGISEGDFVRARITTEQNLNKKSGIFTTTLNEIYREIGLPDKDTFLSLELDIEKSVSRPISDMVLLCNEVLESGKDVYFTSDMYLSADFIFELLKMAGVRAKKEQLLISSEWGCSKRDGRLFQKLIETTGVASFRIAHVGDNVIRDYYIPQKLGICSFLVRPFAYRTQKHQSWDSRILDCAIRAATHPTESFYDIGRSAYGPLLTGFIHWIHQEANKDHIERIFFLARDGFVIQKAYREIFPKEKETTYLYVSSRSLIVPILWIDPSYENLPEVMYLGGSIRLSAFFEKLGLQYTDYAELSAKYGYQEDSMIRIRPREQSEDQKKIRELYEQIKEAVIENSKREYKNLCTYLEKMGFLKENGRVAIVDIGWQGHLQKAIGSLPVVQSRHIEICGYYLGILLGDRNPRYCAKGYWFEKCGTKQEKNIMAAGVHFLELFFTAYHGSTQTYQMNGGNIEPLLFPNDTILSVCEERCIREMHRGAIDFVKEYYSSSSLSALSLTPEEYSERVMNLLLRPTKRQAELFRKIQYWQVNKGVYMAAPESARYYLTHWRRLQYDLKNCGWKTGFLRLLINMDLNNIALLRVARRFLLR